MWVQYVMDGILQVYNVVHSLSGA
uniref:Uncharacterized protein n=1 Tax=Arundo donax TaxID=35708 RepID=A0A0A9FX82_ARUDO